MSLVKIARLFRKKITQAEMDAANAQALKDKPWQIHPKESSGIKPKTVIPRIETKKVVKKLSTGRKVTGLIGAVGLGAAAYGMHRYLKHKKSEGEE